MQEEIKGLCKEWLKALGMKPENFGIHVETYNGNYIKKITFYVYNLAFSTPFVQEHVLDEERRKSSELVLTTDEYDHAKRIMVEIDNHSWMGGTVLSNADEFRNKIIFLGNAKSKPKEMFVDFDIKVQDTYSKDPIERLKNTLNLMWKKPNNSSTGTLTYKVYKTSTYKGKP